MSSGETEPRTESENSMTCQCSACGGTGKCATCIGSGRIERTEIVIARRTRRHRFDTPDPQLRGVWRYGNLSVAKAMTGGETLAKDDSLPTNPDCAEETIWPCAPEDWRLCTKCGNLVCEKHDYRVPVLPPSPFCSDSPDMICKECIAAMWSRGDIAQGPRIQYLY
jgi:hypothetical protein